MHTPGKTTFLNVDLILRGQADFASLVSALGGSILVLHHTPRFACLELSEQPATPEEAVSRWCALLAALPAEVRDAWNQCPERTLDVGIQAGGEPHETCYRLSASALARAASLGVDVVFTVYAPLVCPPSIHAPSLAGGWRERDQPLMDRGVDPPCRRRPPSPGKMEPIPPIRLGAPMTPERELNLLSVPQSVATASGEPRFGTYQGELPEVDLHRLTGKWAPAAELDKLLKRKRWQYTLVSTREVVALFAVVDVGYSANAFAVALDLQTRKLLCDVSFLGVPRLLTEVSNCPGAGLEASFRTLGGKMSARRGATDERYQLQVDVNRLRTGNLRSFAWDGELLVSGGPPALTVIAPVQGDGFVNVTQKRNGLLASGSLRAGGRRFRLDGGVGGMDYTQGYLARRTAWRWAFLAGRLADGTPVGLNLVEGFNLGQGTNENALWLGGRLIPLGRASFEYDRRELMNPWKVRTDDGAVDLRFTPLHVHREDRDLRVVVSRFAQPLGLFEGTVKVDGRTYDLKAMPGVTEDQDMIW